MKLNLNEDEEKNAHNKKSSHHKYFNRQIEVGLVDKELIYILHVVNLDFAAVVKIYQWIICKKEKLLVLLKSIMTLVNPQIEHIKTFF